MVSEYDYYPRVMKNRSERVRTFSDPLAQQSTSIINRTNEPNT